MEPIISRKESSDSEERFDTITMGSSSASETASVSASSLRYQMSPVSV